MEIDCIYFWVVNATRMRDFLVDRLGLQQLADRSTAHTIEYLVGNTHLLFSIASPLDSTSPIADYLKLHPSGVKNISFLVPDLEQIRNRIEKWPMQILAVAPVGEAVQWLKIRGWGTVEHTIVQAPIGLTTSAITTEDSSIGIDRVDLNVAAEDSIIGIDHIVLNVAAGDLELAAIWYMDLFDFKVRQTFDIQTQKSGLVSKALVSGCGQIRFNINEPSSSNSQIQEFLDLNHGAGIQHIALQTRDLFSTIDKSHHQGVKFLPIPHNYYTNLQNRAKVERHHLLTDREWQQLEYLQILMDWSVDTPAQILFQIFTPPIFESPTFFWEFIERRNHAQGFGQGNFQALFAAIEDYSSSSQQIGAQTAKSEITTFNDDSG
jgi:4-hydroxyphenylpyruvate dioxygenase